MTEGVTPNKTACEPKDDSRTLKAEIETLRREFFLQMVLQQKTPSLPSLE